MATYDSSDRLSRCVLIPAAGYGRRAGMPLAKEMLPHPQTGQPLIELSLNCARDCQARAHVITRREKTNLLTYLDERSLGQIISVQIVEPTEEWPDTLLRSKPFWSKLNVVCLPDTEFAPHSVIEQMFVALETHTVAFALTDQPNLASYGALQLQEGDWHHAEKPGEWNESAKAWGLFAFHDHIGADLLKLFQQSTKDHLWRPLPAEPAIFHLDSFYDLTREPRPAERSDHDL